MFCYSSLKGLCVHVDQNEPSAESTDRDYSLELESEKSELTTDQHSGWALPGERAAIAFEIPW